MLLFLGSRAEPNLWTIQQTFTGCWLSARHCGRLKMTAHIFIDLPLRSGVFASSPWVCVVFGATLTNSFWLKCCYASVRAWVSRKWQLPLPVSWSTLSGSSEMPLSPTALTLPFWRDHREALGSTVPANSRFCTCELSNPEPSRWK